MGVNVGKIIAGLLTFFVLMVEVILGLRFVLLITGASPDAEFTAQVYDSSESLATPFEGVFPSYEAASFTLDISTMLAMLVYGLAGYLLIYLARNFDGLIFKPSNPSSQTPVMTTPPQAPPQYMPPQQTYIAPPQYQQPYAPPAYPQQQPQYQQPNPPQGAYSPAPQQTVPQPTPQSNPNDTYPQGNSEGSDHHQQNPNTDLPNQPHVPPGITTDNNS